MKQIYIHTQPVASATWTVTHDLGSFPNIDVRLSSNEKVLPAAIVAIDANTAEIRFSSAMSGSATLVGRGSYPIYTRDGLGGGTVGGDGGGAPVGATFTIEYAYNSGDREGDLVVYRDSSSGDANVGWQIIDNALVVEENPFTFNMEGKGTFLIEDFNLASPDNWDETRSGTLASSSPSTLDSLAASVLRPLSVAWDGLKYNLEPGENALLLMFTEPRQLDTLRLDVTKPDEYGLPGIYRLLADVEQDPVGQPGVLSSQSESQWLSGSSVLFATPRDTFEFLQQVDPETGPNTSIVHGLIICGSNAYPQGTPKSIHGVYEEYTPLTTGQAVFGNRQGLKYLTFRDVGFISFPNTATIALVPPTSGTIGIPDEAIITFYPDLQVAEGTRPDVNSKYVIMMPVESETGSQFWWPVLTAFTNGSEASFLEWFGDRASATSNGSAAILSAWAELSANSPDPFPKAHVFRMVQSQVGDYGVEELVLIWEQTAVDTYQESEIIDPLAVPPQVFISSTQTVIGMSRGTATGDAAAAARAYYKIYENVLDGSTYSYFIRENNSATPVSDVVMVDRDLVQVIRSTEA